VGQLLSNLINILCLFVLARVTPLHLGELITTGAQQVHSLESSFTGCGAEGVHTNCTVEVPKGAEPLFDLLKTGLDQGTATALSGNIEVECKDVTFFKVTIKCMFEDNGVTLSAGANHLTANDTTIKKEKGTLCPTLTKVDGYSGRYPQTPIPTSTSSSSSTSEHSLKTP